jgi:hypothetical protein
MTRFGVVIMCVGAVTFLLRFLLALLQEAKVLSPGAVKVSFAKFNPFRRDKELIVVSPQVPRPARGLGQRVAPLALTVDEFPPRQTRTPAAALTH